MATSSKGGASSRKQSSGGKTRAISVKRKDALPRTVNVSAGRRKPVVQPLADALTEPLPAAVAGSKKKAQGRPETKTAGSRTKATRAAGRAKRPPAVVEAPAVITPAVAPEMVAASEPVAETVDVAEPARPADEVGATTALQAPEVEALGIVEAEMEVEASAIVEETAIVEPSVEAVTLPSTAIGPPPLSEEMRRPPLSRTAAESAAPADPGPHHGKSTLMTGVSRVLSTLFRWTGARP